MFPGVVLHLFLDLWGIFVKTFIKIAIFSVILAGFISSCGSANGADAPDSDKAAKTKVDPDAKFYSFTIEPAAIIVGEETAVLVTVNPADGYKWNDEYPARFQVSGVKGLTIGKNEFKAKKKDIVTKGKKAAFTIPVTAARAGPFSLTLEGGFSVCNETSCKIFRKKTIDLKIEAR